jgi:putative glutamine amidotransferase
MTLPASGARGASGALGPRGAPGAPGAVLVSAATAAKAMPYVAALIAAGVPDAAIRVVTPAGAPSGPAGGAGAGAATSAAPLAGTLPAATIHPATLAADVAELAAGAAGLMLCGGSDVDPRRYGEEPLPGAGVEPLPERDALEWELLAAARDRRLPVWAVCRGFQVLNVFFGGSLWQDLPLQRAGLPAAVTHDPDGPPELLAHSIRVLAPETPLGKRLAAAGPAPRVNSRHHQGVRRLGEGLLAVAAAEDGLVEAVVLGGGVDGGPAAGGAGAVGGDGWWVRGVEWHPENLLALPEQLALWHDFATALGVCEGLPVASGT